MQVRIWTVYAEVNVSTNPSKMLWQPKAYTFIGVDDIDSVMTLMKGRPGRILSILSEDKSDVEIYLQAGQGALVSQ